MESKIDISYDEIAQILKVIESSSIEELHLEIGGIVLDVRRNAGGRLTADPPSLPHRPLPARASAPAVDAVDAVARQPREPVAVPATSPVAAIGVPPATNSFSVTAPMLGTFYRAPAPNAPPFVDIGSVVNVGDTLCIIEVMKLMNTIVAPRAGRVVDIPAANAAIVEYGQAVIVLEPL
ncbi:MAG: acetyl-CoA carboxylase biotin carboxyl carrier protein [Vulcanimicrobiaceae bacterium]